MSIYYIKQDNTVWCCEEDSGPLWEQIEISFVKCECSQIEPDEMAEHLQGHKGGGRVLKWRKANHKETSAWYGGKDEVFDEGMEFERKRIIKLLEEHEPVGFIDGTVECSCKSTTPYQLHLMALIKGEN